MNEYLIIQDRKFKSIKTWPEIKAMLPLLEEQNAEVSIYRLDKKFPERVWPVKVKNSYMLCDIYKNKVEG